MSNADIFRVHADECRLMARFTRDENRRRQWLVMERRWCDLIERDEARYIRHDVRKINLVLNNNGRTPGRHAKYAKRESRHLLSL